MFDFFVDFVFETRKLCGVFKAKVCARRNRIYDGFFGVGEVVEVGMIVE